jgi:adenylate cyclase
MATEIERKFLLRDDGWRACVTHCERIAQGYLVDAAALVAGLARASVRVRISGGNAWFNVKAAQVGIARAEYEYPLPPDDARAMLDDLCGGKVEKIRHCAMVDGASFEVDEFLGVNAGLVVAEIELPAIDASFPRPSWLGREVSHLVRYYNLQLIAHPYANWSADERAAVDAPECPAC